MAGTGGPPRNLGLPRVGSDFIAGPAQKVYEWLDNNTATLRVLTEDQIIQKVRTVLGPAISRLKDEDISAQIQSWASTNRIVLKDPGPPIATKGDPEVLARLKRVFGAIPTQAKWVGDRGTLGIDISGVTSTLNGGKAQYTLTAGFDRAVNFKTQVSGMTFGATLGPKGWNLTFIFGESAPNIPDMEKVFKNGAAALSGVVSNLDQIDPKDPGKTYQNFAPYLDPIKQSVSAASKAAVQRRGKVSVGVWVGGPVPGGTPGVSGPPTVGDSPGNGPANGVSFGAGLTVPF
jgi:hypothetical protein